MRGTGVTLQRQDQARWRAIEAKIGRASTIWLATTRPDGRPHLAPLWFVFLDGLFYVSTGSETRKFHNLRHNQKVAMALPDTESVVIVEGEAHVAHPGVVDKLAQYFFDKYEWDFRDDETADWRLIEVTPARVLAWGEAFDG